MDWKQPYSLLIIIPALFRIILQKIYVTIIKEKFICSSKTLNYVSQYFGLLNTN